MMLVEKCVPLFWFVSGSWKYLNQYIGASLLVLAAGLFGSFCATCNMVACFVIIFGESIFPYRFSTGIDKSLWYSVSVYCHIVLRFEYCYLC